MLYLDLEDLKQSKADGRGGGGAGRRRDYVVLFVKSLLGASVHAPPPLPPLESNVWPTMPESRRVITEKSDPGGDHYYVGYLGQTRVCVFCVCVKQLLKGIVVSFTH